jgi:hypothetical protein
MSPGDGAGVTPRIICGLSKTSWTWHDRNPWNQGEVESLRKAIRDLHGAEAILENVVNIVETFKGQTVGRSRGRL